MCSFRPTHSGATDGYGNFYWDESTETEFGLAAVTANIDCGYASWSCPTWESFNWIRIYNYTNCPNSYRSIYRDQNNPN